MVRDKIDSLVAHALSTGDDSDFGYQTALQQLLGKLLVEAGTRCAEYKKKGDCAEAEDEYCKWVPGRFYVFGGTCVAKESKEDSKGGPSAQSRMQRAIQNMEAELRTLRARKRRGELGNVDHDRMEYLENTLKQVQDVDKDAKKANEKLKDLTKEIKRIEGRIEACDESPKTCNQKQREKLEAERSAKVAERRQHVDGFWSTFAKKHAGKLLVGMSIVVAAVLGLLLLPHVNEFMGNADQLLGRSVSAFKTGTFTVAGAAVGFTLGSFIPIGGHVVGGALGAGAGLTVDIVTKMFGLLSASDIPGSDVRLMRRVVPVTSGPGIRLYRFRYRKEARRAYGYPRGYHVGVLAQDVRQYHPDCVFEVKDEVGGYFLEVDYMCLARRLHLMGGFGR